MADVEITREMIEAGRAEFRRWMQRWDYLADGTPSQPYIDGLLCSIYCGMMARHQVDAFEIAHEPVVILPNLVGGFDQFSKQVILLGGI